MSGVGWGDKTLSPYTDSYLGWGCIEALHSNGVAACPGESSGAFMFANCASIDISEESMG